MTLIEIKKQFKSRAAFADKAISTELGDYYRDTLNMILKLYEEGYIKYFTNDFLKVAYAYENYDKDFYTTVCLDLRSITATKKATRGFAEYWLNS